MKKSNNDELVFLPLGGSNEIGMNLNCYGYGPEHNRQWIIADVGVTFGDQTTPGVEVIVPDASFLEGENILGIVLTHAHEDHIGALGWLWPQLKAPLYATPFTAYLIREKLRDADLLDEVELNEVPLGGTINLKSRSPLAMSERRRVTYNFAVRWAPPFTEQIPLRRPHESHPLLNVGWAEVFDVGQSTRNLGITVNTFYSENIGAAHRSEEHTSELQSH